MSPGAIWNVVRLVHLAGIGKGGDGAHDIIEILHTLSADLWEKGRGQERHMSRYHGDFS